MSSVTTKDILKARGLSEDDIKESADFARKNMKDIEQNLELLAKEAISYIKKGLQEGDDYQIAALMLVGPYSAFISAVRALEDESGQRPYQGSDSNGGSRYN